MTDVGTRKMFVVPCGVWQSRQTTAHEPSRLPAVSAEWSGSAWQSLQSWLELSRASRFPSPLWAAAVVTVTGADFTVPDGTFVACTWSFSDVPSGAAGL